MGEQLFRVGEDVQLSVVHRQVAHPHALVDGQLADVHHELVGDVIRQALHFHLPLHHLQDAVLLLHPHGVAGDVHRHLDLQALLHGDAEEVHVQQQPLYRVHLPVADHGGGLPVALDLQSEDRVLPGFRVQELGDAPRVHAQGHRLVPAAVHDPGHLPGAPQLPGVAFAPLGARLGFDLQSFHASLSS